MREEAETALRLAPDLPQTHVAIGIAHYRGQMSEVARRLRIGRSTLYRKLAQDQSRKPAP